MIQQLHAGQGLGHEDRRLQLFGEHRHAALGQRLEQALGRDHADDVVQAAAADRVARVRLFGDDRAQHLGDRRVGIEPADFGARNHHRADLAVVEAEHVAHHLVLLRLDHAGVQPFFQAGGDLFFRDGPVRVAPDADQPQDGLGGRGQQHHERARGHGQPLHRRRDDGGHRLGKHLADALGHQLAEDDRQHRDDQHHQRRGRDMRRAQPQAEHGVQPLAQRLGERGVADDAVEHADRRDAHLHRRQELGGMVVQVDRRLDAARARFQHHLQARLAARRQRHFRHRETGVQHDQEKEKGDVHREARRAGRVGSRPQAWNSGRAWRPGRTTNRK